MKLKTALTIAGSDCSGGAGIQADLKTMTMNGVYAMSAITALTAQNTTGVTGISEVTPDFLKQQIDMIFADIPPDAVKIGMVPNSQLMEAVAEALTRHQAKNIVVDPVMVATAGSSLMENEAVATLKAKLLPIASLVTPNIPEAEVLSGIKIATQQDMEKAAKIIGQNYGCAVLLKGGHSIFLQRGKQCGSLESALITPTPTAPAAPFLRPSPPIWQRVIPLFQPLNWPKSIFRRHFRPCWTWARAVAP